MREVSGNMFDAHLDALCITTNGKVKINGAAVMGAGCAKQAKDLWPELAPLLGKLITKDGNVSHVLTKQEIGDRCIKIKGTEVVVPYHIVSFPTKNAWYQDAKIDLIVQSTKQLERITNYFDWYDVGVPRPGCGNGKLSWKEIKTILDDYFDNRFIIFDHAA